jgi:FkbM family methyltransferase
MSRLRRRLDAARGRRQWRRYERRNMLDPLLGRFAATYPEATFIELGANDGAQYDHLRPHILANPWTGVMVEPVPHVFERLRRNYGGLDRVRLENAAIADRDGRVAFHHLGELSAEEGSQLPSWYDAIGSISLETVRRNARALPGDERPIISTDVPSLTFESLCRRHAIDRFDLLVIDTEGNDARILSQVELGLRRPRLIVYEHYHLDPAQRAGAVERLRSYGYATKEEFLDTYAIDPLDDELTRVWRSLRPAVPGLSALEAG